jgi:hypothetical protein
MKMNKIKILILLIFSLFFLKNTAYSQKELSFFGKIGVPILCDNAWDNRFDWKKPNLEMDLGAIYYVNNFFFAGMGIGTHFTNVYDEYYYYDHYNYHRIVFRTSYSIFDIYTKIGFQLHATEHISFHISTNQGYAINWLKLRKGYYYEYLREKVPSFLLAPELQILVKASENLFLNAGTNYKMYLALHDYYDYNELFVLNVQLGISYRLKLNKKQ